MLLTKGYPNYWLPFAVTRLLIHIAANDKNGKVKLACKGYLKYPHNFFRLVQVLQKYRTLPHPMCSWPKITHQQLNVTNSTRFSPLPHFLLSPAVLSYSYYTNYFLKVDFNFVLFLTGMLIYKWISKKNGEQKTWTLSNTHKSILFFLITVYSCS
jgi:hypothetical protein